jgi:hypothetical protein
VDCTSAEKPLEAARALDEVLVARWPAAGATFEGEPRPWLNLLTFSEVEPREVGEAPAAVDVERVRAASQFVPVTLRVVRSFDFTGEGFHGDNEAGLTAVLAVPREFEPRYFGAAQLKSAVDDLGNSLVPADESRSYRDRYGWDGRAEEVAPSATVLHRVDFDLKVPPFVAQRIVRLEGSVNLHYGGRKRLLAFPGVLTAEKIREVAGEGAMMDLFDEEEGTAVPLDAGLSVVDASRSGAVMVLKLGYDRAAMTPLKVQAYGAAGRPVPCIMQPDMPWSSCGNENVYALLLFGKVEPPLSLAVLVEEAGPKVELPVVLTDVPIIEAAAKKEVQP